MTAVAVLGAGAGGSAATAELTLSGHAVHLWNRSAGTLQAFERAGGVRYRGELGEGIAEPASMTTDLPAAVRDAEVALLCLPADAHPAVFEELAAMGIGLPIVLNPGGVGGSLQLREVFRLSGGTLPPVAELSTLTYVGRKYEPDTVTVTGVAGSVWGAPLPGGRAALDAARNLYPAVTPAPDVLFTSLSNVNLVLHPPGAVLGAAWIEATGGGFRFYVEGMTPGVVRVLEALDGERRAVGSALGHELPSLVEEMTRIGTAEPEAAARGDTAAAIRGGGANAEIPAPASLDHRYYREDVGFGLRPFVELASIAGVPVPVAAGLLRLAEEACGPILGPSRGAEQMGIAGMDAARLIRSVREEGA